MDIKYSVTRGHYILRGDQMIRVEPPENPCITYFDHSSLRNRSRLFIYEERFVDLFEVKDSEKTIGIYLLPNGQKV